MQVYASLQCVVCHLVATIGTCGLRVNKAYSKQNIWNIVQLKDNILIPKILIRLRH